MKNQSLDSAIATGILRWEKVGEDTYTSTHDGKQTMITDFKPSTNIKDINFVLGLIERNHKELWDEFKKVTAGKNHKSPKDLCVALVKANNNLYYKLNN